MAAPRTEHIPRTDPRHFQIQRTWGDEVLQTVLLPVGTVISTQGFDRYGFRPHSISIRFYARPTTGAS